MRWIGGFLGALALAGCVAPMQTLPPQETATVTGRNLPVQQAARNFVTAVSAVEPVAEALCRERTRGVSCDFNIVIDDRPDQPPNAFQTLDKFGRPVIGFTLALIADTRNVDEIAFVLGHEAAHHIEGHIPQQQQSAQQGALLAGLLVAVGGGGQEAVERATQVGASIGARRYSKDFELEADALGTVITQRAGFDPLRGAEFFARIPDPGDQFLGSHPPNSQRIETVRRVAASQR